MISSGRVFISEEVKKVPKNEKYYPDDCVCYQDEFLLLHDDFLFVKTRLKKSSCQDQSFVGNLKVSSWWNNSRPDETKFSRKRLVIFLTGISWSPYVSMSFDAKIVNNIWQRFCRKNAKLLSIKKWKVNSMHANKCVGVKDASLQGDPRQYTHPKLFCTPFAKNNGRFLSRHKNQHDALTQFVRFLVGT